MSLNPVLVNGPFGSGKTAVCAELLRARPTHASFDTEWLGWLLRTTFQQRKPVAGFQDWLSWRRLSSQRRSASNELGIDVVVPQTVVAEQYWSEIACGLAKRSLPMRASTLYVDPVEHDRRIAADQAEVVDNGH
jgi:hypothetical protein